MRNKKFILTIILAAILFINIFSIASAALSPHGSKEETTKIIDSVARWYESEFGKEYPLARQLMIEIANQESYMGTHKDTYLSDNDRGLGQITPVFMNHVKKKLSEKDNFPRVQKIKNKWGFDPLKVTHEDFLNSDVISAVFMREFILIDPSPIPEDFKSRAIWWKNKYNTKYGEGTTEKYISTNRVIDKLTGDEWVYSGTLPGGLEEYVSPKNYKIRAIASSNGNMCPRYDSLPAENAMISGEEDVDFNCMIGKNLYDNLARLIRIDNDGSENDYAYDYYGDTNKIMLAKMGSAAIENNDLTGNAILNEALEADAQISKWDINGNLLSESFKNYPEERNTNYAYNSNNQLIYAKQNGIEINELYDSQGRPGVQYISYLGKDIVIPITYGYYDNDLIKTITYPGLQFNYFYNNLGQLIKMDVEQRLNEQKFWYSEEYTWNGDLLEKLTNSEGLNLDYSYEKTDYPCPKKVCLNEDCENSYLEQETCSVSIPSTKTVGNYQVKAEGDKVCSNPGTSAEKCHTFLQNFNEEGFITEDDNFNYDWSLDTSSLLTKEKFDGTGVRCSLSPNQFRITMNFPEGDSQTNFFGPFGEINLIVYKSGMTISPITGLLNSITGNALEAPNEEIWLYPIIPGDESSAVTENRLKELLNEENIFPELKESMEIYPQVSQLIAECKDYDNLAMADNTPTIFDSSYATFENEYYFDECTDESHVKEYYCDMNTIDWTFWNPQLAIIKSTVQECPAGCSNGACTIDESAKYQAEIDSLPVSCDNGLWDQHEEGYDCGLVCGNSCTFDENIFYENASDFPAPPKLNNVHNE